MLNYIWAFMIIIGVVYGLLTGNIEQVGNGAIESAEESVKLCITMLGIMSMWMGFMEVAQKSGLIAKAEKMLEPAIKWMFPELPVNHKARTHITTNIIANILGLGWAATPAGLKARRNLQQTRYLKMGRIIPVTFPQMKCVHFWILNISSLQLIPVNMIANRSQYGSANPASIVAPATLATIISTVVGIIFCKNNV